MQMNTAAPIPDQAAWNAWSPQQLAAQLKNIGRPWCVVGGWALDLWHGHSTRVHEDLEFTILREDFAVFRKQLGALDCYTAHAGVLELLPPGQVPGPDIFQVWCFDPTAQVWRVDMMIEPGTPDQWVYKRDTSVAHARPLMVLSAQGIPCLKPAAVLLFKARQKREKDEIDFQRALPRLSAEERRWLKQHLDLLHPGHVWQEQL